MSSGGTTAFVPIPEELLNCLHLKCRICRAEHAIVNLDINLQVTRDEVQQIGETIVKINTTVQSIVDSVTRNHNKIESNIKQVNKLLSDFNDFVERAKGLHEKYDEFIKNHQDSGTLTEDQIFEIFGDHVKKCVGKPKHKVFKIAKRNLGPQQIASMGELETGVIQPPYAPLPQPTCSTATGVTTTLTQSGTTRFENKPRRR